MSTLEVLERLGLEIVEDPPPVVGRLAEIETRDPRASHIEDAGPFRRNYRRARRSIAAKRKGSAGAAGRRRKPLIGQHRVNVVTGSRYPEMTCKGQRDQGRTTGNEPAQASEQSGTETPPVFRVQWLEEPWGASVATEHKQSHRREDEQEKKEQRNRVARQACQEVRLVKERAGRHSCRSPNPRNGGSGWGGFNAHCLRNEGVEKASSNSAPPMPVLQDRGIGDLRASCMKQDLFPLENGVNRIIICCCHDLSRLPMMNFCIPVSRYAIFAPAAPRDFVARIDAEANRSLQVPDVKDKLVTPAIESGGTTPEERTTTLGDEMERIRLPVNLGAPRPE